jgi:hypothetical protein
MPRTPGASAGSTAGPISGALAHPFLYLLAPSYATVGDYLKLPSRTQKGPLRGDS